jgi:threonine dehydratase
LGSFEIPTLQDIWRATESIKGHVNRTPLDYSKTFSDMLNSQVYFKLENLQKTGSFKVRGALHKLSSLSEGERKIGVIAVSAGNHAQGVAYAAKMLGISAKIVMPEFTVPAKVNAVMGYDAQVVLKGKDYNEAREHALSLVKEEGRVFIEGFNDPWIISGQGTIGLEILEDLKDTEAIVVPVGGGGLISGIALAAKYQNPSVKVYGVQSELIDSMKKSVESGNITSHVTGETIADGIAIKYPGDVTLEICRKYVDQIVTVSDESLALGLFKLLERNKILAEPSGAAPLAAALEKKIDISGKKTVMVVSGGNANLLLLSKIIYKSMEMEKQLVRIELKIPDRPGTLQRIASSISEVGGNIYHAEVDNLSEDTPVGYQTITFSVNLMGPDHAKTLMKKLENLGYKFKVSG